MILPTALRPHQNDDRLGALIHAEDGVATSLGLDSHFLLHLSRVQLAFTMVLFLPVCVGVLVEHLAVCRSLFARYLL